MSDHSKQRIRSLLFRLIEALGINAFFRFLTRKKVRILTLHGVGKVEAEHAWIPLRSQLSDQTFKECIRALQKNYQFVSMSEAQRMLAGVEPIKSNCVVVTFDDGYQNNFDVALPILKELDVPATFYIATGYVEDRRPFWFDRLDFVLQQVGKVGKVIELDGQEFDFSEPDRNLIGASYRDLRAFLKTQHRDEQEFVRVLDELASELEEETGKALREIFEEDGWAGVVSVEKLIDASKEEIVEIGSHTVSHLRLGCLSPESVDRELAESKEKLEAWTGKPCLHFAFPNGEYDGYSQQALEKAGFLSSVTSDLGMNEAGSDLFELKRLPIGADVKVPELLARASGVEFAASRLKSIVKRAPSRRGASARAG